MNWFQRAKRAIAPGRRLAFESLEPRWVMSHVAEGLVDTPQTYSGALNGKVVFTSPGHGWQWSSGLGRYATDRPEYQLVEDFGTQDQMTLYADYLLRAGATVVPMRPVGRQINEVVLDNDSAGVTFTGSWSNSAGPDYYDEDYGGGEAVGYRFASTTAGAETAVATYTPNIPSAGFYPVYTWVSRSANRTTQLYTINHTGGSTEIRVDHRQVGYGWVYLGTYHFGSGSSSTLGSVEISNSSPVSGVVIADAIRFGNGMGDFADSGAPGPSGYPREDENSYKWIQRMLGVGTTSTEAIGSGTSNVSAPSNMAEWMFNGVFGNAVYVGIHSNGTTGDPDTATARGAVGLIDSDQGTPNQTNLALFLGRQINQDMQNLPGVFEHNWSTRTTHTFTSGFGEIDLGSNAEMDATIIEVAFHDNIQDGALLRDPKARDQIARSMLQGTLEYFDIHGGLDAPTSLPTGPTNVSAVSNASGEVTINWAPGPSAPASVHGAAATGFRIYASVDGYGFDGGTFVAGGGATSATLTGYDPLLPYYFRVVAVNAGGESKPSEVVTALPSGGAKQVLVVNGFDRFDRTQDFAYPYAYTGDGLVDRVWSRYNNSFDYVVQVHSSIHASHPGTHVASASNEAVINGAVNLGDYDSVIWILGEESTVDDTFNATEQALVEAFIAAGGHLFTSGAEIAFDLDSQGGGVSFFESTLKGNYISDDGGTYNVTVPGGSIFAGIPNFSFSNGNAFSQLDGQLYNVETPDVINPQAGAAAALTYSGGTNGTAAIQVQGTGGRGNIVMFGFPFEAITSAARRTDVMREVLDFFVPPVPMPAVDIETRVNGQDADSPPGATLAAGGSATFTYVLTNIGNVALSSVTVSDDNGTPGVPGDDFAPSFTSGDTNSNSMLDVNETWTYTAVRSAASGQYGSVGSVAAIGNATNVSDSDAVNYFGSAPSVDVETFVEGQDADLPTGPIFAAGDLLALTYVLTNSGNVPVSILMRDSNGTPATFDDFTPTFTGGDTNSNSLLDLGETWTYSTTREARIGQYQGEGKATATDSINQTFVETDGTSYFGAVPGVNIETLVNGDEADSAPGPNLNSGSSATFTYVVTNVGNNALNGVVVTDDNGTPGNTADDFNPTFTSGDTNSNSLLDTDETWTYSALHTVTVGQYTNRGSVSASDSVGQVAGNFDFANHVGIAVENADFNADTIVDTADYVVWRKLNGTTVPAGTLGDANHDTQVDAEDYAIFMNQYGETAGGSGSSLSREPATYEAASSQDAVFSALSAGMVEPEWLGNIARPSRSARAPHAKSAVAVNDNWPALLAAIAEQKAHQAKSPEVFGYCDSALEENAMKRADPDRALAKLAPALWSVIPRIELG
jgi:hypothetical protein